MHETHRLSWDGAIDADAHILEPADLWESYLEPQYQDRALRVVKDENGLDEFEIGGKKASSMMSRHGFPAALATMGGKDLSAMALDPEVTFDNNAAPGARDVKERLQVLDAEHVDAAMIYPTVGLMWEAEFDDPELSQAYSRAYNRWVCEWCSDSGGRLIPAAHLSLTDPVAAASELERAVTEGARVAFVGPFTHGKIPLGHHAHDPLFAAAQDLDVPIAIHPMIEPQWTKGTRMGEWEYVRDLRLSSSLQGTDGIRSQFVTLFDYGVFDTFPRLKVVVLEAGGGWIGYWLDRMDGAFGSTVIGEGVPLANPPSHYFRERCWVSCDPDERMIPALVERFGDRFMWASDFPHPDHSPDYVLDLDELVALLPEKSRRKFLGDNCRELFKIQV